MGYRDMDLDDQVRASLRRERELAGIKIDVNVKNGIVYLRGNVSRRAHQRVLRLAGGVDSVAAVVDQLTET